MTLITHCSRINGVRKLRIHNSTNIITNWPIQNYRENPSTNSHLLGNLGARHGWHFKNTCVLDGNFAHTIDPCTQFGVHYVKPVCEVFIGFWFDSAMLAPVWSMEASSRSGNIWSRVGLEPAVIPSALHRIVLVSVKCTLCVDFCSRQCLWHE